jgi:pSer/pThr/pTyr-binding forkhead associated (FHA) protein
MSVRLTVTQRSEAGGAQPTEIVLTDPEIMLGRDKACQVVLAQQAVSRNHARILQEGTLFFLEDLGSAYGTQVNGKPLPKGEKRMLRNGDVIAIAQFDVRFDRVADVAQDDDAGQSQKTSFMARNLVKDAMRGLSGGEERFLRFMNGPREGERIEISEAQELVIGRDDGVDIVIKTDLASRKHAKVRRDWSGTHVEDLGSRNGIRVNKKKVARKQLKDGDEVDVGGIKLLYVDPTEPPEPPPEPAPRGEDGGSATKGLPSVRERPSSVSKRPVKEEPPKVEVKEEPKPEPEPEPVAEAPPAEEPPPPEPVAPAPPPEPEPEAPADGLSRLGDKQKLVPLVVMGLFGLVALGLIIALLAGA